MSAAACDDGNEIPSAWEPADTEMIGRFFEGTVAEGVEGEVFTCDFEIEGGPVLTVTVFDYGEADDGSSVRRGPSRRLDPLGHLLLGSRKPTVEMIGGIAGLSDAIAEGLAP